MSIGKRQPVSRLATGENVSHERNKTLATVLINTGSRKKRRLRKCRTVYNQNLCFGHDSHLTTSVGHFAWWQILSETLPRRKARTSVSPLLPTIIKSEPSAWAHLTISSAGTPCTILHSQLMPCCFT